MCQKHFDGRFRCVPGNVTVSKRSGDDWTVRATVTNDSGVPAGASVTEFVLDGTTVVARVPTPALEPGISYTATASWSVREVEDAKHELSAIADRDGEVEELSEDTTAAQAGVRAARLRSAGHRPRTGSRCRIPRSEGDAPPVRRRTCLA